MINNLQNNHFLNTSGHDFEWMTGKLIKDDKQAELTLKRTFVSLKNKKNAKFLLFSSEAFHIQHVTHNIQKILTLIEQYLLFWTRASWCEYLSKRCSTIFDHLSVLFQKKSSVHWTLSQEPWFKNNQTSWILWLTQNPWCLVRKVRSRRDNVKKYHFVIGVHKLELLFFIRSSYKTSSKAWDVLNWQYIYIFLNSASSGTGWMWDLGVCCQMFLTTSRPTKPKYWSTPPPPIGWGWGVNQRLSNVHRHKMVIMSCAADEGVFSAQPSHSSSAVHTEQRTADVTDTIPQEFYHMTLHMQSGTTAFYFTIGY